MKDAFGKTFVTFVVIVCGGLVGAAIPDLLELVTPSDVPATWWASRILGLVGYIALWSSMMFGVFMSARGAGGLLHRATVLEMHNRWAVAALLLTGLHVLVTVVDPEYGITALALIYPFASPTKTAGVALGVFATWGMVAIALTTALLRKVGRSAWRAVHAAAFGTFVLALTHGLATGSDAGAPIVRGTYIATATALVAAIVQRLFLAWDGTRKARTT